MADQNGSEGVPKAVACSPYTGDGDSNIAVSPPGPDSSNPKVAACSPGTGCCNPKMSACPPISRPK